MSVGGGHGKIECPALFWVGKPHSGKVGIGPGLFLDNDHVAFELKAAHHFAHKGESNTMHGRVHKWDSQGALRQIGTMDYSRVVGCRDFFQDRRDERVGTVGNRPVPRERIDVFLDGRRHSFVMRRDNLTRIRAIPEDSNVSDGMIVMLDER